MEQNNEQKECEFMANLKLMRAHGICLKISTADISFGGAEPVLAFHIACIGQIDGRDTVLLHGMARTAEILPSVLQNMAVISSELCRICHSRQILGDPVFNEDEMEAVVKGIMRDNGMDIEQLCKPQSSPERESWMFN